MSSVESVCDQIRAAFRDTCSPGDNFLCGSFDGTEGFEVTDPFRGHTSWEAIDPAFLDANRSALNFFSGSAFRFFIPAYLIADLHGTLYDADPTWTLTHRFVPFAYNHRMPGGVTLRRSSGPRTLVNPRRYGAMTSADSARHALSVFTREEAQSIVAYLRYMQTNPDATHDSADIELALTAYWLDRARNAPTTEDLARHLAEEAAWYEAIQSGTR